MLTAGMFVKEKGDAGQAGMVAADAAEGLTKAWGYSVAVPPPVHFIFESDPAGVFKGWDQMVGGETPVIMVLR